MAKDIMKCLFSGFAVALGVVVGYLVIVQIAKWYATK